MMTLHGTLLAPVKETVRTPHHPVVTMDTSLTAIYENVLIPRIPRVHDRRTQLATSSKTAFYQTPWWVAPHAAAAFLVLPLLTATYAISGDVQIYFGRPQKNMNLTLFILGICGLLAFCTGAFIGSRWAFSHRTQRVTTAVSQTVDRSLTYASWLMLALTYFAYFLYLAPVAKNPGLLFATISGSPGAAYAAAASQLHMPGVTTLTQLGIIYSLLLVIRHKYFTLDRISGTEKAMFVVLLAMTFARALAFSERKAIIEMLIPIGILLCRRPRLPPIALVVAPIVAVVLLFIMFSVFEYLRSWVNHYQGIENNFVTFAAYRLFGYYITALDNGAGIVRATGGGVGPVATMEWFWRFPIDFGQRAMLDRIGYSSEVYKTFLFGYASPEFNNPSGLYMPYLDFGKVVGTGYWGVLGFVIGAVYRRFVDGWLMGLILYPILYVGVLEMPRTFALGSPRIFPALVGGILLLAWLKISVKRSVRVA